jgi:hypothetical protein
MGVAAVAPDPAAAAPLADTPTSKIEPVSTWVADERGWSLRGVPPMQLHVASDEGAVRGPRGSRGFGVIASRARVRHDSTLRSSAYGRGRGRGRGRAAMERAQGLAGAAGTPGAPRLGLRGVGGLGAEAPSAVAGSAHPDVSRSRFLGGRRQPGSVETQNDLPLDEFVQQWGRGASQSDELVHSREQVSVMHSSFRSLIWQFSPTQARSRPHPAPPGHGAPNSLRPGKQASVSF